MTGEPFTMAGEADCSSERSETSEERPPEQGLVSPSSLSSQWPTLAPAAYHGIAGRVVRTLEPQTEADPAGLLLTFLAAAGNIIGPGPRAVADAASHPARLNVVLVGQTSRARKGSAWAQIRRLLTQVDPGWSSECLLPGLASGEALIAEVRDAAGDDLGASDKRRLVLEPEFARLLAVASREGATLSAVLREAWDGNQLKNRTKRDPVVATGAHISVVGHVTREELLRRLADTEAANGSPTASCSRWSAAPSTFPRAATWTRQRSTTSPSRSRLRFRAHVGSACSSATRAPGSDGPWPTRSSATAATAWPAR